MGIYSEWKHFKDELNTFNLLKNKNISSKIRREKRFTRKYFRKIEKFRKFSENHKLIIGTHIVIFGNFEKFRKISTFSKIISNGNFFSANFRRNFLFFVANEKY